MCDVYICICIQALCAYICMYIYMYIYIFESNEFEFTHSHPEKKNYIDNLVGNGYDIKSPRLMTLISCFLNT